jgi:protein involved in polysaccharide export with SLBB domain
LNGGTLLNNLISIASSDRVIKHPVTGLLAQFSKAAFCITVLIAFAAGATIFGCSSSPEPGPTEELLARGPVTTDTRVPSAASSPKNQERLKALWDKRSREDKASTDYPVGPGDVIEITVPGVDDLKDRTVRVSGEGQIELPLVGILNVGGLTETGVRDKLKEALTKYMYDPQVDVFVREYHSRQVAVVGAVRAPGLITLTGAGESILDAVTQAGGMTADAADEIVILPEVQGGRAKLQQLAAAYEEEPRGSGSLVVPNGSRNQPNAQTQPSTPDASHEAPGTGITLASLEQNISNGPAVVIPLKSNGYQGSLNYTNMPVEPGDIIVVPGGGNVMVTGWVYRPGFFSVGSGLTVLGAVGSAGGTMYAADGTSATLIRSDGNGNKVSIPVNLQKIATGEEADIPVRANDVIDVPYSDLKIGPYVVYNILTRMAVPLPTP